MYTHMYTHTHTHTHTHTLTIFESHSVKPLMKTTHTPTDRALLADVYTVGLLDSIIPLWD